MSMTSKRNAGLESPVHEREATDGMDRHSIKNEIECPHCFDLMILSSDFDSLSYVCEACGFTLYTTRLATVYPQIDTQLVLAPRANPLRMSPT
jgi:uncharacterized protein (DUF983 family)